MSEPIKASALALRLNPATWPADVSRTDLTAARVHRAFTLAQQVFEEYRHERERNAANERLTPAGIIDANNAWVRANESRLTQALADVTGSLASMEKGRDQAIDEMLGKPADAADAALLGEVRTFLRGLPDGARDRRLMQLAEEGDRTAIRAVLMAPGYLSGVSAETAAGLRDQFYAQADPRRHAAQTAFRNATEVTVRALEGVQRFMTEQAAAHGPVAAPPGTFNLEPEAA